MINSWECSLTATSSICNVTSSSTPLMASTTVLESYVGSLNFGLAIIIVIATIYLILLVWNHVFGADNKTLY